MIGGVPKILHPVFPCHWFAMLALGYYSNDICSQASGLQGDYDGRGVLGFNTLTLVPHQKECIDVDMLSDFEVSTV